MKEGITLDELIEIAHSMDCELHLEFVPRPCKHPVCKASIIPPGVRVHKCVDCGKVLESKWWTKGDGED